ncbi:polyphosphate kinase 2 [Nitratireductor basaltis]|uniref:ADP/GDP-polyphosphate phosphotransferase n=1 Tax=Nitratireductor basaltis TaxID=472175 RepID=A0A084UE10_9HYPH|nr:polyphosphate kinase 2 [Nitratireductor basaltis]KFB11196.1 hypothetical protein EL18_02241 [Nitratireductor basaltis]
MNIPLDKDLAEPVELKVDGKKRVFDIDDPKLPGWIEDNALTADGYPYDDRMDRKKYEKQLEDLQLELVKLQAWQKKSGHRIMALFEGRDAAGKGGTISRIRAYMNPRTARNVALPKPTEAEMGQWYFQRYVAHFPTSGEFVTFDRSWYNRGVVEPVMGFCTPEQHERFLQEVPNFEQALVNDGISLFKFWLNIGQVTQLERFHDRRHSRLKYWKFSPIDIEGMFKWDDYTHYRDIMLERTHTEHAPWTVVKANDKRRARIAVIRHILLSVDYDGRDKDAIGKEDGKIVGKGLDFLK